MRKYYIDNLRILCIFMLFPFHTAMIYNDFGEVWFLKGVPSRAATILNIAVYPWWMSLLFVMAGMSTVYALKHRTVGQYVKERCKKLLIPFIAAILLIVPVQAYIADIVYNQYQGSYFAHYKEFFILTNWNGGDGHFTPGHTWFILYLFIISLLVLPIVNWYQKKEHKFDAAKWSIPKLIPLCLIPFISQLILDIGGKSVGEFAAYFLLGYFFLSREEIQERLKKNCIPLAIIWLSLMLLRCTMYQIDFQGDIVWDIEEGLFSWLGILALLGLGKKFLEFNNGFTHYFTPAAFPIYFFHQSIIVILGYFIMPYIQVPLMQYVVIAVGSFILTIVAYEITKRIPATRFLFGIKKS